MSILNDIFLLLYIYYLTRQTSTTNKVNDGLGVLVGDNGTSKIIYRNVHTVFFSWRLTAVKCATNLYDLDQDDIESKSFNIKDNCIILSEPHEGANTADYHCTRIKSTYDTCNVTGEWDVYDNATEILCNERSRKTYSYLLIYTITMIL